MTHWLLRAATVSVGWTGLAQAQSPLPSATHGVGATPRVAARAAESEDVVLLMRTTGQPDRKLKVLKRSTFDDGESFLDVQDVATGQTFTLPGKLADRLPRLGAAPPVVAAPRPAYQPAPAAQPSQHLAVAPAPVPALPISPPAPAAGLEWKPIAPDTTLAPKPTTALVPVPSPTTTPLTAVPSPTTMPVGSPDRWKPIPAPIPLPPTPSPIPKPPSDDAITVRGQMPSSLGGRPTAFRRPGDAPPKLPPLTDAMGALPPAPDHRLPSALPKLFVAAPTPASPSLVAAPSQPPRAVNSSLPTPQPQPPRATGSGQPTPQFQPAFPPPRAIVSSLPTPSYPPPGDTPVWRPSQPAVLSTPLPGEPAPRPVTASQPPFSPMMPAAIPPFSPVAQLPKPLPVEPTKPGTARIGGPAGPELNPTAPERTPAPVAAGERGGSWTPVPPKVALERKGPEVELRRAVLEEIRSLETTLTVAVRPSERIAAATNLAESRYAARPEVKAVLARSAMTDPALAVRVECIRALAELGHADADYLAYLQASTSPSTEESLRLAATAALLQVRPKE